MVIDIDSGNLFYMITAIIVFRAIAVSHRRKDRRIDAAVSRARNVGGAL